MLDNSLDLDNTLWKNDPFIEDADIPNWNEVPGELRSDEGMGHNNVFLRL